MGATSLILVTALAAAVGAVAWRRLARARRGRELASRPGASFAAPIAIRAFDEMDAHLRAWRCICGARPSLVGEGPRQAGERRFRVARLRCDVCEDEALAWFETTELLQ